MPPRYAYWTIIVDNQPTAFRAAMPEELMPTFKRLKQKHPSAEMKWFQNGKLWNSRVEAQEAMRERGERGREGDKRQGGGFRDRKRSSGFQSDRPDWKPKPEAPSPKSSRSNLEWKPKGEFTPAPKRADRPDRPEWKSKPSFDRGRKPAWKPKSSFDRDRKPEWKPKSSFDRDRKPEWKPKGSFDRNRRPDWKPRGAPPASAGGSEKRKWVPKEEYKKSKGIAAPRDSKWRPGGEHRDPRQKYKDAKKAKWTRFKKAIHTKWEAKQGPRKKRRDDES